MKKIFIDIFQDNWKLLDYYIDSFTDIINKYDLNVYIFSKKYEKEYIKKIKYLQIKRIFLNFYKSLEDLKNKIKILNKENEITYINTFDEKLINITNKLKLELWIKVTKNHEVLTNKYMQRKLLFKKSKNITIKYLKLSNWEININNIKRKIWLPFIIKPIKWTESSWVKKINIIDNFNNYLSNYKNEFIIEEYIDWDMYSIDYFVDKDQKIQIFKPVKIILWTNIWIDDFFNLSRIISTQVENELNNHHIKDFIQKNIKAYDIKNTFIHHEFKLTKNNELKTIELNWRIWWYRLEMYKEWYNKNILRSIFNKQWFLEKKINYNFAVFAIYPKNRSILKSYNYKLFEDIKKLQSFHSLRIFPEKYEWKEIWLTKDWFWKVWGIKIKNRDYLQFKKDYDFIEKSYKNLLILN